MSHHPQLDNEEYSDASSEEYEPVSYATACEDITSVIDGDIFPIESKERINNKEQKQETIPCRSKAIVFNGIIGILSKITPEVMLITQQEDMKSFWVILTVNKGWQWWCWTNRTALKLHRTYSYKGTSTDPSHQTPLTNTNTNLSTYSGPLRTLST